MNRKNENIRLAVKGTCFILIFLALFWCVQMLFQPKWIVDGRENTASTDTWKEYRSLEPNTLDALFIGTSHVYSAIDSMYIYKNSGITTYPLSGPGMRFDLSYMVMEDALKTQQPKVVFLDMSAVHFGVQQTEGKCHKVSDHLPLSKSKVEYAFNNGVMKPLDVLFPLFRYHDRWDSLKDLDFRYLLGSLRETAIRGHYINHEQVATRYTFDDPVDPAEEVRTTERDMMYLRRMAELCREKGIELVLCKIPAPVWYRCQSEESERIAQELGVRYEEFYYNAEEIGLPADGGVYRDKGNHMNQYGAERMSAYLAQYIQEHYDVEDQRGKNAQWDEDVELYERFIASVQPVV